MQAFVFLSALREFIRARRIAVWLVLAVAAWGFAMTWRSGRPGVSADAIYSQVSEVLVFRVLALCSAIYTTAIISQEVEQKTITYLLTRPVQRWKLLFGRYLASVAVVALIGFVGASFTAIGAYGTSWLGSKLLWNDFLAVVFGAFAYGALFLLISLIVNRAMIVCLLFAFGWETAVPNMPGEVYYISVFSYMKAIAQHPSTDIGGPLGLLSGALGLNTISVGAAMT